MNLRAGVFVISAFLAVPAMPAGEPQAASRKIAVVESIADRGANIALTLEDGTVVEVARELVRVRGGSVPQGKRGNEARRARVDAAALSRANKPAAVVILYKDDGSVRRARIHLFESAARAKQFAAGAGKPDSDR